MATKQKIRIKVKSYDHVLLDSAVEKIISTAEKNGAKEDVVKKAQESFKDDVKKLFEGKRGGKFWGVVAGTVAAGALIGLALKPSNKS